MPENRKKHTGENAVQERRRELRRRIDGLRAQLEREVFSEDYRRRSSAFQSALGELVMDLELEGVEALAGKGLCDASDLLRELEKLQAVISQMLTNFSAVLNEPPKDAGGMSIGEIRKGLKPFVPPAAAPEASASIPNTKESFWSPVLSLDPLSVAAAIVGLWALFHLVVNVRTLIHLG